MSQRLVSVIRRVRGNTDFAIADDVTGRDLLTESLRRGTDALRAYWSLRRVKGAGPRFAERGVRIEFRRHCSIGPGSVLEHSAHLRCLSANGVILGRGVTIGKYAILECSGSLRLLSRGISIGDGSSVGDFSYVGAAGGVTIGSNVLMGQRVSIHAQNHTFDDLDLPIRDQGTTQNGVVIEDDCWIGSGSIILDGVTIGAGSVIAAGSIVSHSIPRHSVAAGAPARVVRTRGAKG